MSISKTTLQSSRRRPETVGDLYLDEKLSNLIGDYTELSDAIVNIVYDAGVARAGARPEQTVCVYSDRTRTFVDAGRELSDEIVRTETPEKQLTAIYVGAGTTSIGPYVLSGSTGLKRVFAPHVTSVGDGAFYGCSALTQYVLDECLSVGASAFMGTGISECAFRSAVKIGEKAFCGCGNLTDASCPALTSIGYMAFQDDARLTSVRFPSLSAGPAELLKNLNLKKADVGLTSIPSYAFTYCRQLKEFECDTLCVDNEAFAYCNKLESVSLPNLTAFPTRVFDPNQPWMGKNAAFANCLALTSVYIPQARIIGQQLFERCVSLKYVCMPSAEDLSTGVFWDCHALETIDFGDSMETAPHFSNQLLYGFSREVDMVVPDGMVAAFVNSLSSVNNKERIRIYTQSEYKLVRRKDIPAGYKEYTQILHDLSADGYASKNWVNIQNYVKADSLRYQIAYASEAGGGAYELSDNAVNTILTDQNAQCVLPRQVPGRARDFLVRAKLRGERVPKLTFAGYENEPVEFESGEDEFHEPDLSGDWLYSFTETAQSKFAVSVKKLKPLELG